MQLTTPNSNGPQLTKKQLLTFGPDETTMCIDSHINLFAFPLRYTPTTHLHSSREI